MTRDNNTGNANRSPMSGSYGMSIGPRSPVLRRRQIRHGRIAVVVAVASFLSSIGATIQQSKTGEMGGHPAVKLRYRIPGRNGRPAVNDIEYDTLVGTSGAALVVVGHLDGHDADPALVAWITSTIRAA